jgi:uncharacterized protein YfkK (UPF0435 family)
MNIYVVEAVELHNSDFEDLEDIYKLIVVRTTDGFNMYHLCLVSDDVDYTDFSSDELEDDGWSYL